MAKIRRVQPKTRLSKLGEQAKSEADMRFIQTQQEAEAGPSATRHFTNLEQGQMIRRGERQ